MRILLNAYLDLAHWYGVTPYIGAGAGLSVIETQANATYRFSNGTLYGDGNNYCGVTGNAALPCYHLGYPEQCRPQVDQLQFRLCADGRLLLRHFQPAEGRHRLSLPEHGPSISSQEFRAGVRITPDG